MTIINNLNEMDIPQDMYLELMAQNPLTLGAVYAAGRLIGYQDAIKNNQKTLDVMTMRSEEGR